MQNIAKYACPVLYCVQNPIAVGISLSSYDHYKNTNVNHQWLKYYIKPLNNMWSKNIWYITWINLRAIILQCLRWFGAAYLTSLWHIANLTSLWHIAKTVITKFEDFMVIKLQLVGRHILFGVFCTNQGPKL